MPTAHCSRVHGTLRVPFRAQQCTRARCGGVGNGDTACALSALGAQAPPTLAMATVRNPEVCALLLRLLPLMSAAASAFVMDTLERLCLRQVRLAALHRHCARCMRTVGWRR